jgi:hypothetical protein
MQDAAAFLQERACQYVSQTLVGLPRPAEAYTAGAASQSAKVQLGAPIL